MDRAADLVVPADDRVKLPRLREAHLASLHSNSTDSILRV